MKALDQFHADIEAFLKRSGMPPTTFGKKAAGDAMFVQRIRQGADPKISTAAKVREFMENFWAEKRLKGDSAPRA